MGSSNHLTGRHRVLHDRLHQSTRTSIALDLALCAALATMVFGGCASRRPPVSKIVNGRIVVARAISPDAYEHAIRAELYEEEQRWEDAALELQRALTFDSEGAELRAHLADVLLQLNRVDDAASQAAESLKTAPTVDGYLASARVGEARHESRNAMEHYQAAARLARRDGNPEAVEASHLALAVAQMTALDINGAHDTVVLLRDLDADSLRARVQLAALAWALGRLPEAEAALREALVIEPAEIDARLMLAALQVAAGRAEEAKATFREAINRAEESTSIAEIYLKWLVARGDRAEAANEADRLIPDVVDDITVETIVRIERACGRPARALAAAATAREHGLAPSRVALLSAGAAADAKDVEGAVRTLLQIGRGTPEFVDSRLRAAELLRELGTPDALNRAERALNEADAAVSSPQGEGNRPSRSDGSSHPGGQGVGQPASREGTGEDGGQEGTGTDLTIARALLAEKRGDAIRAASILDAALDRTSRSASTSTFDPRLLLARAAIEERRGDWRRALEYAERVLEMNPRNVEALNFHGFVSAEHGHALEVTTRRLQIAVALDPGAGGVVDSLGWAYLQSGELGRAAELLAEASRLEPGDAEILFHLGELYVKQGESGRAIATYQDALAHSPTDTLARNIQKRLRELGAKRAAGR